jgi:hypothetical protein
MQNSSNNSSPDSVNPISYQNRLSFWFHYFLRRELSLAKQVNGLIKPYFPKIRDKKSNQLLLTGPAPLPAPPSEIYLSGMDSINGASKA